MKLKSKDKNIFFIADTHFNHKNIIRLDNRPFDSIEDMNNTIIENWNNKVGQNDIVFHVGDFSMSRSKKDKDIFHQLNGEKHLILGNHDHIRHILKFKTDKLDGFKSINSYLDLLIDNQYICLSHYPMMSWNKAHYGSWMIHGHCHQNLTKNPNYDWYYKQKVIDIGCNGHNYTPLSYFEIKEIMKK